MKIVPEIIGLSISVAALIFAIGYAEGWASIREAWLDFQYRRAFRRYQRERDKQLHKAIKAWCNDPGQQAQDEAEYKALAGIVWPQHSADLTIYNATDDRQKWN